MTLESDCLGFYNKPFAFRGNWIIMMFIDYDDVLTVCSNVLHHRAVTLNF